MADFPYSPHPANIKRFIEEQIPKVGVPKRVTQKFLESIGYKSKNDRQIPRVLKTLGFLDSSSNPTDRWKDYRNNSQAKQIMADTIREAYSSLFDIYPDAYRKDDEALRNFFSSHTEVGESTVALIVRTFRDLCELADFESQAPVPTPTLENNVPPDIQTGRGVNEVPVAGGLTINLNIQLQLPETNEADVYDKLFEALKKHLLT